MKWTIKTVMILNATYVFICALLNHIGFMEGIATAMKTTMIIASMICVIMQVFHWIKNNNQLSKTVKRVFFMNIVRVGRKPPNKVRKK